MKDQKSDVYSPLPPPPSPGEMREMLNFRKNITVLEIFENVFMKNTKIVLSNFENMLL